MRAMRHTNHADCYQQKALYNASPDRAGPFQNLREVLTTISTRAPSQRNGEVGGSTRQKARQLPPTISAQMRVVCKGITLITTKN